MVFGFFAAAYTLVRKGAIGGATTLRTLAFHGVSNLVRLLPRRAQSLTDRQTQLLAKACASMSLMVILCQVGPRWPLRGHLVSFPCPLAGAVSLGSSSWAFQNKLSGCAAGPSGL